MLHQTLKPALRRIVGHGGYEALHDLKVRARHWCRLLSGQDPWFRGDARVPIERHGDWFVSPEALSEASIVYSLGIGRDISFDLSIISRYGVSVQAFDPTPSAVAWLAQQALPPQFRAMEVGVAGFDGEAVFSLPADPGNPSFGYQGRADATGGNVTCQVRRLPTLMQHLNHAHIDLLKMDIEGAEYEVIDDLLAAQVPIGQLLVEFHHRKPGIGADKTRRAVSRLREAGFRLVHISSSGQEMVFLGQRRESSVQ
jgi:FkbM family methyltransferase